jgi:hypothetical protein
MADVNKPNETMERRVLTITQRAAGDSEKPIIEGDAAVFNQETIILDYFREMIEPGAFKRVLSEKPDVVAALNHNWDKILGRTTAGTLSLEETETSLQYAIDVNPDDTEAMNTYHKVKRGDVTQASFAFTVRRQEWISPTDPAELPLRIIKEVDQLYDVGPCTFGAYPEASASARSKAAEFQTPAARQEPGPGAAATERQESLDVLQRRLELASKE